MVSWGLTVIIFSSYLHFLDDVIALLFYVSDPSVNIDIQSKKHNTTWALCIVCHVNESGSKLVCWSKYTVCLSILA